MAGEISNDTELTSIKSTTLIPVVDPDEASAANRNKYVKRTALLTDPNFAYIRSDGNDTTGNGSPSAPWLTMAKAITEGYKTFNFGVGTFAGGTTALTGEFSVVGAGENKTTITALTFSTGNNANRLVTRGVTITTLTLPSSPSNTSFELVAPCVGSGGIVMRGAGIVTITGGQSLGILNLNGVDGVTPGSHGTAGGALIARNFLAFTHISAYGGNGAQGTPGSPGDPETGGGTGGTGGSGDSGGSVNLFGCFCGGTINVAGGGGGPGGDPGSDGGGGPGVAGDPGNNGANGGVIVSQSKCGDVAFADTFEASCSTFTVTPASTITAGGYNVAASAPIP